MFMSLEKAEEKYVQEQIFKFENSQRKIYIVWRYLFQNVYKILCNKIAKLLNIIVIKWK